MATAGEIPDAMLKIVECSVCMLSYNTSDREPQSLRCGHSFCKLCTQKLAQNAFVNCPKCRDRSRINQLRKNFSLIEMLETLCVECIAKPRMKTCGSCQKVLCRQCLEDHKTRFYAKVKSDIQQLDDCIAAASDVVENNQGKNEEKDRLNDTLSAIRLDVKNAQDSIASFGKELEEAVTALHKENMAKQDKWSSDTKTVLEKYRHSVSDMQGKVDASSKDTFPDMNVDDFKEKCKIMKDDILRLLSDMPQMKRYHYLKSSEGPVTKQILGEVKTDLLNKGKEIANDTPNIKEPSIIRLTQQYDYNRARIIFTRGAYGRSFKQFRRPEDVAVDRNGNIIVLDSGNDRIKIFDPSLDVISVFGEVEVKSPAGVCISQDNEVYITDPINCCIQVYSTNGAFRRAFGKFGTGGKLLKIPSCIACGNDSLVYVVDNGDDVIYVFKTDGTYVKSIQDRTVLFKCIAVTNDDKILVTTYSHESKCRVYDTNGKYLMSFPSDRDVDYFHLTVDKSGDIFIYNDMDKTVEVFESPGQYLCDFKADAVQDCAGIAVDSKGRVFMTDRDTDKLKIFSSTM